MGYKRRKNGTQLVVSIKKNANGTWHWRVREPFEGGVIPELGDGLVEGVNTVAGNCETTSKNLLKGERKNAGAPDFETACKEANEAVIEVENRWEKLNNSG